MVRRNTIGNTAEEINLDFLHEQLLLAMKKIKISDGSIDKDTVLREITAYYERKFSSLTNDAFSYDFIDLFCGAGGLSIGLEQVGFKPIIAIDKDEAALRTYRFNRPWMTEQSLIHEDIRDLVDSDILPHVPVIVGGPPCQGFSNANRQHTTIISMNNRLVKEYVRAILELKPRAFVMENVAMLKSQVHRFMVEEKDLDDSRVMGMDLTSDEVELLPASSVFEGALEFVTSIKKDNTLTWADSFYKIINLLYRYRINQ